MKDKGKWLHSSHHLLIVAEMGEFCLLFVKNSISYLLLYSIPHRYDTLVTACLQNCHILVNANEKAGSLFAGNRLHIAVLLLKNRLTHGKTDSRAVYRGIPSPVKAFKNMRQLLCRDPLSAILDSNTGMQRIIRSFIL